MRRPPRSQPGLILGASLSLLMTMTCATGAGHESQRAAGSPAPPAGITSRLNEKGVDASLHPILVGAAVRDITPELGPDHRVRVAGFRPGRAATGVHDALYARALVVEAGEESMALVALDILGLFHDDVVKIRQEVRRLSPLIGIGYIMVAATHTHAGPDVLGLWTPAGISLDAAYLDRVRRMAAESVAEAWDRRRPARISIASKRLPRLVRDSRLPLAVDDVALLLKAESADGTETIATLVNFANHPESLGRGNSMISSDYPWATREILEGAFGGVSIFVSGAIGGLMTPLGIEIEDPETGAPAPPESFRMAEVLGQSLARALIAAWSLRADDPNAPQEHVSLGALAVRSKVVRVPLANRRFIDGLTRGRIWPRAIDADGALTSEVAVATLRGGPDGESVAQFACVPGEIYPELVNGGIQIPQDPGADLQGEPPEQELRSMMSGRFRFVIGMCNDELGYIIPISQWDEKPPFAYGRDGPQYGEGNSAGPHTAPILMEAFADILR